jgi:hypothetical protein
MQADEGQGPETQQGIGSLGPEPMQQMPAPNRMGAQYGGRIGYRDGSPHYSSEAADAYSSMGETDESTIMKKIQFLMSEFGLSKEEAFERVVPEFRKSIKPDPREDITQEEIIEQLRPRDPGFIRPAPDWDRDPGFIRPAPDWDRDPGFTRPPRPRRRLEEIEEVGIKSLRGRS